ncbi:MAG: putative maturation protein [Alehxovirus allonemorishabitans]|uniref:Maturation protein n=1 Tax=Leviviridae sp. TaxID=2027243 RepID=A0ABY3SUU2_9VIRU|nr:MAG: putative maturation protein [Leviviridae sp.]
MTRSIRTRTRLGSLPDGSFTGHYNGVPVTELNSSHAASINRSVCDDSHGRPTTDSNLSIVSTDFSQVGPVQGIFTANPVWDGKASGYVPSFIRFSNIGHLDLPSRPTPASSVATLLARTNPSRPEYAPLTLLQDLVDIPGMLKEAGKLVTRGHRGGLRGRDVGNTHLGLQFGWIPLVNDAIKVIQVHKHIQDRVRELNRLYSTQGLKRRIRLGNWGAASVSAPVMESYPILSISTILSTITTSERWGTVRWRPTGTFLGYRPESHVILQQAKDALSGVTSEGTFEGAWDLLPWSWLADWGTNVKDYVMAHANTVPATPSSVNVMTRTVTVFRPRVLSITPSYSWEPGFYSITSKERYVGSGAIDAHIPFLDMGRLSILGALAVQRFKR